MQGQDQTERRAQMGYPEGQAQMGYLQGHSQMGYSYEQTGNSLGQGQMHYTGGQGQATYMRDPAQTKYMEQNSTGYMSEQGPRNSKEETNTIDTSVVNPPQQSVNRIQLKIMLKFLTMMSIDVGLPIALYYILKPHFSSLVPPLLISAVPTALWAIGSMLIARRLDYLGILMVFSFILSAILSVVSGDPRVIVLREGFVTGCIGFVFGCTLIPISFRFRGKTFHVRPFTFWVSRNWMDGGPDAAEAAWTHSRWCRISHRTISGMWTVALLGEFIVRLVIILAFTQIPIDRAVDIINIVLGVMVGSTVVITTIMQRFFIPRVQRDMMTMRKDSGL